jgi:hypothetical protein
LLEKNEITEHGCMFSLAMVGNLIYNDPSGNDIHVWRHLELNEHCKFGHGDRAVKCISNMLGDRILTPERGSHMIICG